jgi:hypothetical protein
MMKPRPLLSMIGTISAARLSTLDEGAVLNRAYGPQQVHFEARTYFRQRGRRDAG